MLQYVLWSECPPTFSELIDAIAVHLDESPGFRQENRLFDLMDVIIECSSLLTIVNKTEDWSEEVYQEVHIAHSSVKEYLTSQHLVQPFNVLLSEFQARATIVKTEILYIIDVANLQYEATKHLGMPSRHLRPQYRGRPPQLDRPAKELNESGFPFLRSASFWAKHVRVLEGIEREVMQHVLQLYGQKHLLRRFPKIFELGLSLEHDFQYRPDAWHLHDVEDSHPFIHACFWGLEMVVQYMLDAGTSPNCGTIDSPLHAASSNGH